MVVPSSNVAIEKNITTIANGTQTKERKRELAKLGNDSSEQRTATPRDDVARRAVESSRRRTAVGTAHRLIDEVHDVDVDATCESKR